MQHPMAPSDWLWVSVHDTGIGIPEDKQPDVFEKFKQVSNALTDRPEGTGLGLPICREIVEHHEGHIWVESTFGAGSTFHFVIPLERQLAPELPQETPAETVFVKPTTRPGCLLYTSPSPRDRS